MGKKSSSKQVAVDPFDGVGESTGIEIWRVEDMKPVPVKSTHHGDFYTGDSYLVLHTVKNGAAKTHDLHFWLGSESSQDETGAAAIFATELDDKLGGKAKQYRQVQEAESPEFLQLFKGGVRYLEGGVKSGFKHVVKDQAPLPSLLKIKGDKGDAVRVVEVELSTASLNSGDIFILDLFDTITQWVGKDASVQEKAKARGVLESMKEKRRGKTQVTVLEESDASDAHKSFYSALGATEGSEVSIAPAAPGSASPKPSAEQPPTLYKIGGGTANENVLSISDVGKAPLSSSLLEGSSLHALTAGGRLFIWQCKGAHSAGSRADVGLAGRVLTQLGLSPATPVEIVKEGEEGESFKQHFDWTARLSESTPATAKDSTKSSGKEDSEHTSDMKPGPSMSSASPAVSPNPAGHGDGTEGQPAAVTPPSPSPGKPVAPQDALPRASPATAAGFEEKVSVQSNGQIQSPSSTVPAPATPESTGPSKTPRFSNQASPNTEIVKGGPEPRRPIRKLNLESIWQKPADAQKIVSPKDAVFILKPQVYEPSGPPRPVADVKIAPGTQTFSHEALKGMRVESGIDVTRKEDYLSPEDFEKVFGQTPDQFKALAKWKQLRAKKDQGLF